LLFAKVANVVNFRNREDYSYMINKVKEYFNTLTDEKWVEYAKMNLKFDSQSGKMYRLSPNTFSIAQLGGDYEKGEPAAYTFIPNNQFYLNLFR
jgi:hypothetical protein